MVENELKRVSESLGEHEAPPFQIDSVVPARPVSFRVLRNLIACIGHNQPMTYTQIVERPAKAIQAVLMKDDGQPMKRSPRYHYLNALKIMGLVQQQSRSYLLSSSGEDLARSHIGDDSDSVLPETVRLFQAAIRSSTLVQRNFLVLFTGDAQADPWKCGQPIHLNPIPGQRTYELTCSNWPGRMVLSRKQTQGIIWGLREWCQAIGLVDEVFIRPQGDVGPEHANILFPIDPDLSESITVDTFGTILANYLPLDQPIYGDTVSISIPLLFYRLCPSERLPVKAAQSLLRRWLSKNSQCAFAEAPSYSVLESGHFRRGTAPTIWQKQERAFLRIGDKLYSRLLVSKSVWVKEGE